MVVHHASCRCGAVTIRCAGEPVRVSVCHCLACQKRSGSAFSAQARFPAADVVLTGATNTYVRTADSGNRATYRFCPACGVTVAYGLENRPDLVAIPIGLFDRPSFSTQPRFSVYERRKLPWVDILCAEHSA